MLEAFVDRFLKEGKEEGLCQVAINMLKEKCDKALIKKYTGLSDAKIAKLEKTLQSVQIYMCKSYCKNYMVCLKACHIFFA